MSKPIVLVHGKLARTPDDEGFDDLDVTVKLGEEEFSGAAYDILNSGEMSVVLVSDKLTDGFGRLLPLSLQRHPDSNRLEVTVRLAVMTELSNFYNQE